MLGFSQYFLHARNNLIKFISLSRGLKLVLEHQLCPIEINIDSKEVILILKNGNLLYSPLIHEYRLVLRRLGCSPIYHSYRGQNMVADALSKYDARMNVFDNCRTFATPSSFVAQFVWADL